MADAIRDMIRFDADPANISAARRFVRSTISDSVPASVTSDVQLIVSELVSNAIEHGSDPVVGLELVLGPDAVWVAVTTGAHAEALGATDTWSVADADEVSGRGLGIVRQIADAVSIADRGDGAIVRARVDVPPIAPAP